MRYYQKIHKVALGKEYTFIAFLNYLLTSLA